ncbi:hypothetical protein P3T39_005873 [Kitasatospora sp. GP82]|nr:hypothetical protein [Kitasatospora sp. GP82]
MVAQRPDDRAAGRRGGGPGRGDLRADQSLHRGACQRLTGASATRECRRSRPVHGFGRDATGCPVLDLDGDGHRFGGDECRAVGAGHTGGALRRKPVRGQLRCAQAFRFPGLRRGQGPCLGQGRRDRPEDDRLVSSGADAGRTAGRHPCHQPRLQQRRGDGVPVRVAVGHRRAGRCTWAAQGPVRLRKPPAAARADGGARLPGNALVVLPGGDGRGGAAGVQPGAQGRRGGPHQRSVVRQTRRPYGHGEHWNRYEYGHRSDGKPEFGFQPG